MASDPSAFAVLSSRKEENMGRRAAFNEADARAAAFLISPGHGLMNLFIRDWRRVIEEKHQ